MNRLVPLFVALPLCGGFLIPLVPDRWRTFSSAAGNTVMALLTLMACGFVGQGGVIVCHMGGWGHVPTPLGIDLRLDALSVLMLLVVNGIGLASTVFSSAYMRSYTGEAKYYSLFLFMVAGMNGVVITGDLFNLYVFMEIAAIASYALVGFGCGREELEATFKYMVLGCVASAFVLIGIALVYGVTGTLNMGQIAARVHGLEERSTPLLFSLALFICGFGLKAALVPFHAWLPDAHPSAPAPISAMLSGVVIKAIGVYVLARLLFNVFGAPAQTLSILRWLGALSMVAGVLLAVGQWDMKRLFAYHSISQIGYVVLALGVGTPLGLVAGLYHLLNHSIFKSLFFLNAGSVEYTVGTRDLKRIGGMGRKMPVTASTSLIASMSIAGIPPFNGFWSKLLIVMACVQKGYYGMAVWAVFVSLMTLASFLKVQRYAFLEGMIESAGEFRRTPVLMGAAMVALAVLCIAASFLMLTGVQTPALIKPAAEALAAGLPGGGV